MTVKTPFHLTGVFRTENDDFATLQTQVNTCPTRHAGGEAIGGESPGVVDHEIGRTKGLKLFVSWPNEHGVHEQGMVWPRTDDANFQSLPGIPSCIGINNIKPRLGVQIIDGSLSIDQIGPLFQSKIDRAPPDIGFRLRVLDNSLVLRRPTGFISGVSHQRTSAADGCSRVKAYCLFVQARWTGISDHRFDSNPMV